MCDPKVFIPMMKNMRGFCQKATQLTKIYNFRKLFNYYQTQTKQISTVLVVEYLYLSIIKTSIICTKNCFMDISIHFYLILVH